MALINNWDLKDVNNRVFDTIAGGEQYGITDLGATFGRTGNVITRSKGVSKDYAETTFIAEVTATHVDFVMQSRPFFPLVVHLPHYRSRTRMESIVKRHSDRRRALDRQLASDSCPSSRSATAFRASGFSPDDVEAYTQVVVQRIRALQDLSPQVSHRFRCGPTARIAFPDGSFIDRTASTEILQTLARRSASSACCGRIGRP